MGVNIPNDQSWLHFFGNYQLPKLNKFISDGIDTYVGNDSWSFWSSWLNLYPRGSNQDKHLHAGYDLSACYYHCTSPEQGLINFHSPLRESQLDCYGTYQQMAVPTESGTLIIFPSWLEHSTTPNESDFFKISIGMNIKVTKSGERPFLGQSYGKHTRNPQIQRNLRCISSNCLSVTQCKPLLPWALWGFFLSSFLS